MTSDFSYRLISNNKIKYHFTQYEVWVRNFQRPLTRKNRKPFLCVDPIAKHPIKANREKMSKNEIEQFKRYLR